MQAQDECDNAILLTDLDNWCSATAAYTTVTASSSPFGSPTCWGGALQNDVWFKFVAIAPNVSIKIYGQEYNQGTLRRPRVALYGGDCTGTITELGCEVSANGEHFVELYRNGLAVGQTYLIRVDALNGGSFNGTFAVCINNYLAPSVAGQDCSTATQLCNTDALSFQFNGGAGSNNDEANNTCLDTYNTDPFAPNSESNSTWLKWECGTSGTLDFVIIPTNSSDDIDFAVFELPNGVNNCNGKQLLRCMASSCTQGGGTAFTGLLGSETDFIEDPGCTFPDNNFVDEINMTAGTAYALLINNFSSASASNGFLIQFGGTGGFTDLEAAFDITRDCDGDEVTFTDNSTNAASYEWNFGIGASQETSTAPGPHVITYPPGSYTAVLTITDAGGCQDLDYIAFDIPQETLIYTTTINGVSCGATNDGSITVDVTAGTGPYQYSNDGGSTFTAPMASATYTFSGLTGGDYDIVVLTDLGCQETSTETVGSAGSISIDNVSSSPATCGAADGSITVDISGGTGPYQYSSDNGSTFSPAQAGTSYTFNGLMANSYTIVVMDAMGCSQSAPATVTTTAGVMISNIMTTDETCTAADGSAEVTISGGTGPFQFSSDGGSSYSPPQASTTYTFTGLSSGPYTIFIQDAASCTDNQAIVIGTIDMTVSSTINQSICLGDSIQFGNNYYSIAGSYADSLLAFNGCDSISYLNLSINPLVTGSESVTICAGSSYTMPLGEVISSAGTFMDTIPAFNCDSIVSVTVTVDAFTTGSTNVTLCPNESYTMPLGEVVFLAGMYVDTIPGATCDSIVTVNISINGYGMGVASAAFCPGGSHILPGGTVVSTGGVYMDTIPGFSCDSIVVVTVTELMYSSGFENPTICEGQDYTMPAGEVISAAGVYFDTIPGFNCDSIVTVSLNVMPLASGTDNVSLCEGETYIMPLGEVVTTSGIFTDTIPRAVCDSIVTVTVNVYPLATGSVSETICASDSTTIDGVNYYSSSGVFVDTIPGSQCDSVVTLDLTVEVSPSSSPSASLCFGDSITINGTDYYNSTGIYIDTIATGGCDSIVTLSLTIIPNSTGSLALGLCTGDSTTINGSDYYHTTGIYIDTLPGSVCDSIVTLDLTVSDVSVNTLFETVCFGDSSTINGVDYYYSTGVYSDTLTGSRCDSAVFLNLTVVMPSSHTLTQSICQGSSATINGVDFYSTTGIYTDTLMGWQCDSFVTLDLTVHQLMIDNINTVNVNCNGLPGQADIIHSGSTGAIVYAVTDGGGNTVNYGSLPITLDAGDYTLTITDDLGCSDQGSFSIGADSLEGFDLTPANSTIFLGESVTLEAYPALGEFTWTPPYFLSCDTCATAISTPEYSVQYIVHNDRAGCITSNTAFIEVRQPEAFLPTAFSPNGDQVNDLLMVMDKNIDELIFFKIYNRWGELLFETSDINEGWDGTFKSKDQEVDTYVFHILVTLYTGQPFELKGEVLLLR